jgi:hypothetical protein
VTPRRACVWDFAALFRARRPECTAEDGALARALRNIASDVRLPKELRPDTLTSDALAEAAIDGLNYQSSDRRPGIEERRVSLLVREVTLTPFALKALARLCSTARLCLGKRLCSRLTRYTYCSFPPRVDFKMNSSSTLFHAESP